MYIYICMHVGAGNSTDESNSYTGECKDTNKLFTPSFLAVIVTSLTKIGTPYTQRMCIYVYTASMFLKVYIYMYVVRCVCMHAYMHVFSYLQINKCIEMCLCVCVFVISPQH